MILEKEEVTVKNDGALVVKGLSKSYNDGPLIFAGLDLRVEQGEVVCIVGPSGAGKTTLLRCLAGLLSPTTGSVALGGRQLSGPAPEIGVVFQDYSRSLLPWMHARENVAFPLEGKKFSRVERRSIAERYLAQVGLPGAGAKYPWEMSGGMQQRVAIARALAYRSQVLLMDEPFASVDAQTRFDLEDLVLGLRRDLGITVVLVTHDIDEAVYLSDRVFVLSGKPTRLVDVVEVGLGTHRDQLVTRNDPTFAHARTRILAEVRGVPQDSPEA